MKEFFSPEKSARFSRNLPPRGVSGSVDFKLTFERCRRDPSDFRSECVRRAREIHETANAPVQVHLSGGIDSEIVARSFREADVPFQAVSFSYRSGNDHDLRWASDFCREFEIDHRVIPFDEKAFLQEEAFDLMSKYGSYDLYPAFEIERVKRTDGFAVLGNGEPQLAWSASSGEVHLAESRGDTVAWEWQHETGHKGCFYFFRSSPELVLSFLRDPLVALWAEKAPRLKMLELSWWKYCVYKKHWPDLQKRRKWTGYERFATQYRAVEANLKTEFPQTGDVSRISYAEAISCLRF